ncbi:MAG TPA: polysaccharide biosynthesis protein, partial [Petrotoga sp.]|nr:polysaccharide biosynthesis protein [Petrotoga sp.]
NYRMDEMSAALGFAQMKRIEEISSKRKEKAMNYFDLFKSEERVVLPFIPKEVTSQSWFVFVLRLNLDLVSELIHIPKWVRNFELPMKIEGEQNRKEWKELVNKIRNILQIFLKKLSEKGVESKNYFYPVHLQPFYRKMFGYEEGNYPVTELISSLTFAIPFFSNISFEEQNYVYQTIAESLTEIKNETFD